jgi:cytochrome b
MSDRLRVWDRSIRLFHWLLVLLIVSAYVTRTYVDDPTLYLHRLNGYCVLTLLLFRLLWGLVGSSTARFGSFIPGPGAIVRYGAALLRGRRLHYFGHNPLGSLLIVALLLAVAAQASTGLFTSDDAIAQGPLYDHVSEATSKLAGRYHARGFWIILALAAIHIVANLTYQFGLRDRVITAMVTGTKPPGSYVDAHPVRLAPAWRAAVCLAVSVTLVWGSVVLSGGSLLR